MLAQRMNILTSTPRTFHFGFIFLPFFGKLFLFLLFSLFLEINHHFSTLFWSSRILKFIIITGTKKS